MNSFSLTTYLVLFSFYYYYDSFFSKAAEKPSFRRLVGRRHGVVAFTGFYEWKQDDRGERQPYYFHYKDGRPLLVRLAYRELYVYCYY